MLKIKELLLNKKFLIILCIIFTIMFIIGFYIGILRIIKEICICKK